MAKKAPIKIPSLYPQETIELGGNKITLREYKPMDKPLVFAIEEIQKKTRPIIQKVGEFQAEIMEISQDNDGNALSDSELKEKGLLDRIYEITDKVQDMELELRRIADELIDGDNGTDELNGPAYLLAQRGLKRFYYPDTPTSKLDEIDDIELGRSYVTPITNIMIKLANPPRGIEKSIMQKQKELEEAGKGKPG